MDVSDLQILVTEIGPNCNLAHLHTRCPAHLGAERYDGLDCSHPLDDETIVTTAKRFYQLGFHGLVAWHFYNEPCLYLERMSGLMARIRHDSPTAKFLLWTNGTLLLDDPTPLAGLDCACITNYGGDHRPQNIAALGQVCPRVAVRPAALDERRQPLLAEPSDAPCQRPYTEFIIDCFGNVHLCCIDWRGLASPGNIMRDGLDTCLANWRASANKIVGKRMSADAPNACRRCPMRFAYRSDFR